MFVSDVFLLGLLALATIADLRFRRIPNPLIVLGLCLGVGIGNSLGGLDGALESLLGGLVGLLVFLPFFALRWMGAGDVKLLCAVGTFVGLPAILLVALYTGLAGGALGLGSQFLVRLGWASGAPISDSGGAVARAGLPGIHQRIWGRFKAASFQLPYAVAISIGTIIWLITRGA